MLRGPTFVNHKLAVFVRHAIVANHPACPSAVLPDAADRVTDRTDHPSSRRRSFATCVVVMFVADPAFSME
jgi:hypothetical protein